MDKILIAIPIIGTILLVAYVIDNIISGIKQFLKECIKQAEIYEKQAEDLKHEQKHCGIVHDQLEAYKSMKFEKGFKIDNSDGID